MRALLLCHRRDPRVSGRDFHQRWGAGRAKLAGDHAGALGFVEYLQIHQVSRWNIPYNAIRLSRSWPLAALFSLLRGLPVPALGADRAETREERWDMVEVFLFPDQSALERALIDDGAAAARAAIGADLEGWTRRTAAIAAQTVVAFADPAQPAPAAVTLFCLRARPPMDRTAMLDYWLDEHRPLVVSLQAALRYARYEQHAVRVGTPLEAAAGALARAEGAPFDGVAALYYGGLGAIWRGLFSPRTQIANLKLVHDEVGFIDGGRSALVLGRIRHRL